MGSLTKELGSQIKSTWGVREGSHGEKSSVGIYMIPCVALIKLSTCQNNSHRNREPQEMVTSVTVFINTGCCAGTSSSDSRCMSAWGSVTVLMTELALEHEQKYQVEKGESHSWQIGTYKQSHKSMNVHGNGIGNSETWSLDTGSES